MRSLIRTAIALVVALLCGCGLLYLNQDRMIFYPRAYEAGREDGWKVLEFETPEGTQAAYYRGPDTTVPVTVWVLFGGNAARARDWDFLAGPASKARPDYGFLAVEYPGYGANEGNPGRNSINRAAEGAVAALAGELGVEVDAVEAVTAILGKSLGAAVSFETAARWGRPRVIVVAPFTSMQDMAGSMVGRPLSFVVRHRWDNRDRLAELSRVEGVRITLFHGDADRVIPHAMGEALAKGYPGICEFHTVRGAGHDDILAEIEPDLLRLLTE